MVEYAFSCHNCNNEIGKVTIPETVVLHNLKPNAKLMSLELNCLECGTPNKFKFNPLLDFQL